MKLCQLVASLLILLSLSPVALSATYHVVQRSDDANDAHLGTVSRPWKTLGRAARSVRAGDTVIVHGGVYRETVTFSAGGAAGAPITLRAAAGEQPVITGADEVRTWARVEGPDPIYHTPWDRVFAIDVREGQPVRTHGAEAPVGRAEQVFWWGKPLRMVMRREQLAPSTFTIDDEEKRLYAWFPGDPARGGAEVAARDLLLEGRSGEGATGRRRASLISSCRG